MSPQTETHRSCTFCGEPIPTERSYQARYCTTSCGRRAYEKRLKHNRRCAHCRSRMPETLSYQAKYCGEECRQQARRQVGPIQYMRYPDFVSDTHPAPCISYVKIFEDAANGRSRSITSAKTICGSCPYRIPCRRYGLAGPEDWGIWGGLTAEERLQVQSRTLNEAR